MDERIESNPKTGEKGVRLDELCSTILGAFDFIDEHLYEFCMDNRKYSDYSYQLNPIDGVPSARVKIDRIGLEKGQNFSLHYDFGDDWMFVIHVQKIALENVENTVRVIKAKRYIKQYPDWDDDEYDFEWSVSLCNLSERGRKSDWRN